MTEDGPRRVPQDEIEKKTKLATPEPTPEPEPAPKKITKEEKTEIVGELELPSKAALYEPGVADGGIIRLKPLTAREEKLFSGTTGSPDDLVNRVLERCVVSEVDLDKLLITDRFYALLMLRVNSYGSLYGFRLQCSSCNLTFRHEIDIMDLPVQSFDEEEDIHEPFECVLPRSGDTVGFRLLRGSDEKAIAKYTASKYSGEEQQRRGPVASQQDDQGDPAYNYRVARQILYVNEEKYGTVSSLNKALTYVESLVGNDSIFLRDEISERDVGVDTLLEVSCKRCGYTMELTMPFSSEFFRPRRRRKAKRS
jgi:hypothetical protein